MNWKLLVEAIDYYKSKGFIQIDVPWLVPCEVAAYTLPDERKVNNLFELKNNMTIIGSAEQGFIDMYLKNRLPESNYVACSPCFRDEPVLDDWHQQYFMKAELFSKHYSPENMEYVLATAESWYETLGLSVTRVDLGDGQTDLCCNGIELGSYGKRTIKDKTFIYGTGHAEPRTSFTKAINTIQQQ